MEAWEAGRDQDWMGIGDVVISFDDVRGRMSTRSSGRRAELPVLSLPRQVSVLRFQVSALPLVGLALRAGRAAGQGCPALPVRCPCLKRRFQRRVRPVTGVTVSTAGEYKQALPGHPAHFRQKRATVAPPDLLQNRDREWASRLCKWGGKARLSDGAVRCPLLAFFLLI